MLRRHSIGIFSLLETETSGIGRIGVSRFCYEGMTMVQAWSRCQEPGSLKRQYLEGDSGISAFAGGQEGFPTTRLSATRVLPSLRPSHMGAEDNYGL